MRQSWFIRLILGLLATMWLSSGVAVAENAKSMAEMQKALNAEVLSKPFSVAERAKPRPTTEAVQKQSSTTRRSRHYHRSPSYSRLHLGFHYGRPYRHYGYGFHKGYRHRHDYRYRH